MSKDKSEGDAMSAASLVLGYLNQGVQYYSEQASAMILIADMAPEHAANAAERILREAAHWAQESGRGLGSRPFTWISERPLMVALRERSHAKLDPFDVGGAAQAYLGMPASVKRLLDLR